MNIRHGLQLGLALVMALAGCGQAPEETDTTAASPTAPSEPTASPTIREMNVLEFLAPVEPGTYFIDPDGDPSTPLRVMYEIPVEGWESWIGAATFGEYGHVGVSITTVENLVSHGCRDHSPADPPVGPSVDNLAAALADLASFRVTSPPEDVTIYGYSGKHLEWTVAGCEGGDHNSWIAPLLGDTAFSGYEGPGYTEEFWILDVDGTRLMIVAHRSAGAPREDLAEQQAILDSIRIEP